jgi:hypothetical protein
LKMNGEDSKLCGDCGHCNGQYRDRAGNSVTVDLIDLIWLDLTLRLY